MRLRPEQIAGLGMLLLAALLATGATATQPWFSALDALRLPRAAVLAEALAALVLAGHVLTRGRSRRDLRPIAAGAAIVAVALALRLFGPPLGLLP